MKVMLKPKEQILLYGLPQHEAQLHTLQVLLTHKKFQVQRLSAADAGRTVADCLHPSDVVCAAADTVPPEPMVLFSRLSDRRLNEALALLHADPVELKATVTGTNCGWTLAQLYAELCRERTAIRSAQNNKGGRQADELEKE